VHDAQYLRSQARLCLQVARQISDARAADNLRLQAARYFAQAMDAEAHSGGAGQFASRKGLRLMARYLFTVELEGATLRDEEGEIFTCLQEAEVHAAVVADELTRNSTRRVVVHVTNEDGVVLAKASAPVEY
jgi:hypothetical protein